MTRKAAQLIRYGTSSLVLLAAAQVQAQDTSRQATEVDEIVVTGIRAAALSAELRKREADVVLDGISADDIGLLPDVSISESLTRIPGVTANDTARGSDQVAIRGLGPDMVLTQFNGRVLPTADGVNRRVGLGGLPSEGLRAAMVQKTPSAESIEGGVAGILSLETIRPLETRRQGLTIVARGLYEDLSDSFSAADKAKPFGMRGEATYVGRITDRLGVSLTYAGIKDYNAQTGVQLEGWRQGTGARADLDGNGTPDALPTNAGAIGQFFNTERHSAIGMVQWEASDWLKISLDGLFSKEKNSNQTRRFFALNLFEGALGAPTSITIENDTVTQIEGASALHRGVLNNNTIKDHTYAAGLNFEFNNGGPLTAKVDFSYGEAGRDRFTPVVAFDNDGTTPVSQRLPFSYDITRRGDVSFDFSALTPEDFAIQQVNTTKQDSSDVIKAWRADFEYEFDGGLLSSVEWGARYERRTHNQSVDNTLYQFANLGARPDLEGHLVQSQRNPFASRASRFGGSSAVGFPWYDFDALYDLGTTANGVRVLDQFEQDVSASFRVKENTYSFYGQANLVLGPVSGNVGLRYVATDMGTHGQAGTTPENAIDQKAYNTYDYLLPSLNLRFDAADDVTVRFGAARTLSRPLFEQLKIGAGVDLTDISSGIININRGNPRLMPFTSDGIDLGVEWYPGRGTSVAIATYYKWVSNFTRTEQTTGTITLADGSTALANITQVVNDPDTRYFRGVEVQMRKDFDFLPGFLADFGVQANYNYNETDAREEFISLAGPAAVSTTVEVLPINLSKHIVNAILYYDTPALNFRLAYRYSSGYSRRFARGYQYQPGGQLDFNFGVAVSQRVKVIGTVTNILGASQYRLTEDSRNPNNDRLLQFYGYRGRDFALGIRAQF